MKTLTAKSDTKKKYAGFLASTKVDLWRKKEQEADEDIRQGQLSGPYGTKAQVRKALARLKK